MAYLITININIILKKTEIFMK